MNDILIPTIIQEKSSGEVLMLGYMNSLALSKTKETGWVYFWSRSRNALWKKGETSGNMFKVQEMFSDCDTDTYLIKVTLEGKNACHKGFKNCFYTKIL